MRRAISSLVLVLCLAGWSTSDALETILRPIGPGYSSENVPIGDTLNWMCVDEDSSDASWSFTPAPVLNGTAVRATAGDREDLYVVSPITPDPNQKISSVAVYFTSSHDPEGSDFHAFVEPLILVSETLYPGFPTQVTGTFLSYNQVWLTNPGTGEPWAWSDLNALQVGIIQSADPGTTTYTSQVYAVIVTNDNVPVHLTTWGRVKRTYRPHS